MYDMLCSELSSVDWLDWLTDWLFVLDGKTHGIANVPFPHQHASKKAAMGTREYLVILNELGHGAGGKVYKALYMPTFQLLAVKVRASVSLEILLQRSLQLSSCYMNRSSACTTRRSATRWCASSSRCT